MAIVGGSFSPNGQASRLAKQSGVAPQRVDPDGSSEDYWWRVLVAAHGRGKVQEIVKNAAWEVEQRDGELKSAHRACSEALDTAELLDEPATADSVLQMDKLQAGNVAFGNQTVDQCEADITVGEKKTYTGGGAYIGGSGMGEDVPGYRFPHIPMGL